MDDEIVPVRMIATCHTSDCPVDGTGFEADLYPMPVEPTYRAQCGRCGQPVTDLVPVG